MRKAADEGHRVVLVVATRGEHGEVDDGFLAEASNSGNAGWSKPMLPQRFSAQPGPSFSAMSIPE